MADEEKPEFDGVQKLYRSTCSACVAAGVDPDLVTWEHKDMQAHAKEFHAHITAGVHGPEYVKTLKPKSHGPKK